MNCGSEVGLSRWLFLNVPIFVLYVCHDNGYFYDDDDYVNDMKKKEKTFFTSLRWMLWWLWWWQQRWYVEQNVVWLLSWMLFYLTEFHVTCGNSFGKSNEILGISCSLFFSTDIFLSFFGKLNLLLSMILVKCMLVQKLHLKNKK